MLANILVMHLADHLKRDLTTTGSDNQKLFARFKIRNRFLVMKDDLLDHFGSVLNLEGVL